MPLNALKILSTFFLEFQIVKRYDWSFQELKNNNFTIVYP
ncbi:MAG: hypothetical protein RL708_2724 [Bacteroidota bacterium]